MSLVAPALTPSPLTPRPSRLTRATRFVRRHTGTTNSAVTLRTRSTTRCCCGGYCPRVGAVLKHSNSHNSFYNYNRGVLFYLIHPETMHMYTDGKDFPAAVRI